jgi:gas vesicle protein
MSNERDGGNGWAMALLVGLGAGLAAGLFLRSEAGERLTDEACKGAARLRDDVRRKAQEAGQMSREKYEEIVNGLTDRYRETANLTGEQLRIVKKHLMRDWDLLREDLAEASERATRIAEKRMIDFDA